MVAERELTGLDPGLTGVEDPALDGAAGCLLGEWETRVHVAVAGGDARDVAAVKRDRAARLRDEAARCRDRLADLDERSGVTHDAAADRRSAAADRHAAFADRHWAAVDRDAAAADRALLADLRAANDSRGLRSCPQCGCPLGTSASG